MNSEIIAIADYFKQLCKRRKIVLIRDVLRRDRSTPQNIRHWILSGNIGLKLHHDAFFDKGLRTKTCPLGRIKGNGVIVYLTENEEYVRECIALHTEMLAEFNKISALTEEFASEIRRIGVDGSD